jgi:prevent-host-death family protein
MTTVGAYEAKTHLPALLARVEHGERVTITRHGRAVAVLVPAEQTSPIESVLAELLEVRAELLESGRQDFNVRDLVEDGRRR